MIRDRPLAARGVRCASTRSSAASLGALPMRRVSTSRASTALPPIDGDAVQLRQVFVNLVDNARTGRRSRRARCASAAGSTARMVEVAVEDSGPGVDPEMRRRLFEPLITTKAKGIGLGLALVKRLVSDTAATSATRRAPAVAPASWCGYRSRRPFARFEPTMSEPRGVILLVDDNAALVDNLAEILEDAGYGTRRAHGCVAARAQAAAGFDVALVDLRLPDGDGTMLAKELKERAPDAQVILLTGHASTESAAAAVRAGAFAYLVKPTPPGDLLLTVEQAIERVRLVEERRELGRRARRAEKLAAVGTLAAGLSHEIKNPLNAAALQLTVLERRLKRVPNLPPDTFGPLALVQAEIKRLAAFLDEFLQFARPREIIRANVNVTELMDNVVDLLRPQATGAQLTLQTRLEPLPPIEVDAARLQQVLMNLLLNAIQATPAGGQVRLDARVDGTDVLLAIEDSGAGIPAAVRDRIFEPFFTTKDAGTGLGLPLVHSIVQQHGGAISVESSEWGGARFVVRLPIVTP